MTYIAVMDYRTASIKLYGAETEIDNAEQWLLANTDYSDSECYYMCSTSPINVYTVHTVKLTGSMPIEERIERPSTRVMRTRGAL